MNMNNLIPADEFCSNHNIEISFISTLQETGLIEVTTIEETEFIHVSQLQQLEKIMHLYHDLDINIEGIDAIFNLLQRIDDMQGEITSLKNRLRLYEDTEL